VYDLAPWNQTAARAVRGFRERRPVTPIFLYVPAQPGLGALVRSCATLPGTYLDFQAPYGSHEGAVVAAGIRWILANHPRRQLMQFFGALLPDLSPQLQGFFRVAFNQAPCALDVGQVAGVLHVAPRTVERWCAEVALPRPKRILLWIAFVYIVIAARQNRRSLSHVAKGVGLDPKRIFDLRRELIPKEASRDGSQADELDQVLGTFAHEWRVPRLLVDRALQVSIQE
jgi:AraC-like DNA-binding protein